MFELGEPNINNGIPDENKLEDQKDLDIYI